MSRRNEAAVIPNRDLAALPGGNIARPPSDRFQSLQSLVDRGRAAGPPVRAYISCVLGCPYEGPVSFERVASLAGRLHELGCEEIASATPWARGRRSSACRVVKATAHRVPLGRIAMHFHDTRGQALGNLLACLGLGVSIIDAALAGLGGCPMRPGRAADA